MLGFGAAVYHAHRGNRAGYHGGPLTTGLMRLQKSAHNPAPILPRGFALRS